MKSRGAFFGELRFDLRLQLLFQLFADLRLERFDVDPATVDLVRREGHPCQSHRAVAQKLDVAGARRGHHSRRGRTELLADLRQ